jgi:HEAT repeat protein
VTKQNDPGLIALAGGLKDPDWNVRLRTAQALVANPSTRDHVNLALVQAVQDSNPYVRIAVRERVSKIDTADKTTLLELASILEKGSKEVEGSARAALERSANSPLLGTAEKSAIQSFLHGQLELKQLRERFLSPTSQGMTIPDCMVDRINNNLLKEGINRH